MNSIFFLIGVFANFFVPLKSRINGFFQCPFLERQLGGGGGFFITLIISIV